MSEHVWVGAEHDQAWMRGGSYLVARRIRMRIEGWDRDFLRDQESVFGRVKVSGAPLGGARGTTPDLPLLRVKSQAALRRRSRAHRVPARRRRAEERRVDGASDRRAGLRDPALDAQANCFIVLGHDQRDVKAGDFVDVMVMDGLV